MLEHRPQLDRIVDRMRADEPAWDEPREQRLLAGALERGARKVRRRRVSRVAGGALLLLAAAGGAWWSTRTQAPTTVATPRAQPASTAGPAPVRPPGGEQLALPDGSIAELRPGARVHVRERRPELLRVHHEVGIAVYTVRFAAGRTLVVDANGVQVNPAVQGTRFEIAVEGESVSVHVERGQVEARTGGRHVLLGAGEGTSLRAGDETPVKAPPSPAPAPVRRLTPAAPPPPSASALLARADEARRLGRLDEASASVRQAIALHPRDPHTGTAYFTLGRIERARGRATEAADAFARCRRAASGSLAEDALAEEALALTAAGRDGASLASEYLTRYPDGPHASRMRRLLK